jgi:hypothetical protein
MTLSNIVVGKVESVVLVRAIPHTEVTKPSLA